jgi:hypothetical protein
VLAASEIGVEGLLEVFAATLHIESRLAVVQIGLVRGRIKRPFRVRAAIVALARAEGATRLRIELRAANPTLLDVVVRRYGFVSYGGIEVWEVELE